MSNLHEVKGMNRFCGPGVLAAFTGLDTDRCAAVLSAVTGKKEIKAVERSALREALKRLRFEVKETPYSGSTLYGSLFKMRGHNGLYMVHVPHHVIAVEVNGDEIYVCDNHSKNPLDIKQSARLMQKVEEVWFVEPKATLKFIRSEISIAKGFIETTIYRKDVYENPEDNNTSYLGSFKTSSRLEYHEIVVKLMEAEND